MGHRLCTLVPTLPRLLDPLLPDGTVISDQEREKKCRYEIFNKRHRVHDLNKISPGDQVWVTDLKVTGTVVEKHPTTHSYRVDVPQGTVRRKQHFLSPIDVKDGGGSQLSENSTETQNALAPQTYSILSVQREQ